jgi:glycosyltransferase involved in cell wall biosynthesis
MNGGRGSGRLERGGRGRRPSIALVHYAAQPIIGGVESVMAAHARLMVADGLEVRIVAGRGSAPPPGCALRVVPLMNPRHPRIDAAQRDLNAGRIPPDFDRLVDELRGELDQALASVDVVFAHNVGSLNLNLALTVALRALTDDAIDHPEAAPRFVLWHHDLAAVMADYRGALHDGWPWSLVREAWPGTTPVVVSEHRRDELAALSGLDPGSIAVVPNGVDLARAWKLEPGAAALFERMARGGIDLLVLVPARITPRKNLELALAIVAELRAAGCSAAVVVTGPVDPHRPSEDAYLERLLALRSELGLDAVAWLLAEESRDDVPDSVVSDLYRMADLLLISSHDEGFGLPILEAAASRLPIACTDLPTLHEIAGPDALYFELDDPPAAIAARIVARLAGDPAWRLARRVRFRYAWEQVYRQFIAPLLEA